MQKKWVSILEVCIGTLIGYSVSFFAQMHILPAFGFKITLMENFWLTNFFTIISLVRGYMVRRMFNYIHIKEWL